jgi:hypothetical protein
VEGWLSASATSWWTWPSCGITASATLIRADSTRARVFHSRLGLTADDAETLRRALLDAAQERQAELLETDADEFGRRYVLDFEMTSAVGTATVRSAWIVLAGQDVLRLASCYVL